LRVRFPLHLQKEYETINKTEGETMQEEYIMTSIDSDVQFVDNMSDLSVNDPKYMTDEERDDANDLDLTDEDAEEVLYEATEDTLVNTVVDTAFGLTSKESKSLRKAVKKAKLKSLPTIPTNKYVVNVHEDNVNRLANHFNRRIK